MPGGVRRGFTGVAATLVAALLPVTSAAAALPPPAPISPAPISWARLAGSVPAKALRGAVELGPASPAERLHLDVALDLPDPAGLRSYLAALSDRRSPLFHHFLSPGQFGQLFGPNLAEVAAVSAALRSVGLVPGVVSPNHLSIPVEATVGTAEAALRTRIDDYRLAGGRVAYAPASAPEMPASVAPFVQGVLGLSDVARARPAGLTAAPVRGPLSTSRLRPRATPRTAGLRPRATPRTAGPLACGAAATTAGAEGAYTAGQLADAYRMTPLYALGDFGYGVTVALVELAPDLPSDIAAYQSCYGTDAIVSYQAVDGGAGAMSDGSVEPTGDIEDVIGLAPKAAIEVYQAPNNPSALYDDYSAIINQDTAQVVSTSWGQCEVALSPAMVQAEQTLFEQAASQGQTVVAAAGDTGVLGCWTDTGSSYQTDVVVEDPASQPYVLGVGGTSLTAPPYASSTSELVWNDADGAGGGGLSSGWAMPAYQSEYAVPGVANSYDAASSCGSPSGPCRESPDVSADADPQSGYVVYYTGPGPAGSPSGWQAGGGTSLAAPLWAAIAALVDASPFCAGYASGDAGALPDGLYYIAGSNGLGAAYYPSAFTDITQGNNDWTSSGYSSGGLYPATPGFDMASGLGSPLVAHDGNFVPGLAADICYAYATTGVTAAVTSVSPSSGPDNVATTVTITGSGFLPIPGADQVDLNGTLDANVTCSSTTQCTAQLPPQSSPQTVDVRMAVEDLTESPTTSADTFTYTQPAPPAVTGLDPTLGPPAGGTQVTVTGTSFTGATSVTFGGVAASFTVVSPTTITATSPAHAAGSVDVVVTTPAGSSAISSADVFSYQAGYLAESPTRILDTRPGSGLAQGITGPIQPGTVYTVQVAGLANVPASAKAVALNVTAVTPAGPGNLRVFPAGPAPTASTINYIPGATVANFDVVALSGAGTISIETFGSDVNVLLDVTGYFTAAAAYAPQTPARILDTRPGSGLTQGITGPIQPGTVYPVSVAGLGGVPTSATSVALNITAVAPAGPGNLRIFPDTTPGSTTAPNASTINYNSPETTANFDLVAVPSDGKIDIETFGSATNVVIDVEGYASTGIDTATPTRILDTRPASQLGAITGPVQPGTVESVPLAGAAGVPANASAVLVNVTAVTPAGVGNLRIFPDTAPGATTAPGASTINYIPGVTSANFVIVQLPADGKVDFETFGSATNVTLDLVGYLPAGGG